MREAYLTADGLSPLLVSPDIASALQGLYPSDDADRRGEGAVAPPDGPVAPDLAATVQGLSPSDRANLRGKDPGGPPLLVSADIASAIQGLYSSESADRNGKDPEEPSMLIATGIALSVSVLRSAGDAGLDSGDPGMPSAPLAGPCPGPPSAPEPDDAPGPDDEPVGHLLALPGPDGPPSVQEPGYDIYDEPVDHLAEPLVTGSVPATGPLMYKDGDLWFPGVAGSRVRLVRFDGGKLMDVDPGTVSGRDVSALRALYGIILGSGPDAAAAKPEGRIGLDVFLELAGHGSVDRGDRIETAKDAMSRYNGLIGKAADRSICHMVDIIYHGGSNDTVSFTSPYLDILLREAPPQAR